MIAVQWLNQLAWLILNLTALAWVKLMFPNSRLGMVLNVLI